MVIFDDINTRNNALVRKGLSAAVFVAPTSAPPITALTDATGELVTIPVAYRALGWISEDGITWPRETEVSDIYGLGGSEPIRSDIRRSTKRMNVTALETNIVTLEQYIGMSLAAVVTSGGGESSFDEAELPPFNYVRLLAIAKDITDTGEYYRGQHFLRTRVTETAEQTWQDGDEATSYGLTYTAFQDDDEGTAVRHFLAGPGRAPVDEGFPAPESS